MTDKQTIAQREAIKELYAAERKIETAKDMIDKIDSDQGRNPSKAVREADQAMQALDNARYWAKNPDGG